MYKGTPGKLASIASTRSITGHAINIEEIIGLLTVACTDATNTAVALEAQQAFLFRA